jgi:hypothetical protein
LARVISNFAIMFVIDIAQMQQVARKASRALQFSAEDWRRRRDSNPRYGNSPYGGLANRWFQPLTHVSGCEAHRPSGDGRARAAPSRGYIGWISRHQLERTVRAEPTANALTWAAFRRFTAVGPAQAGKRERTSRCPRARTAAATAAIRIAAIASSGCGRRATGPDAVAATASNRRRTPV